MVMLSVAFIAFLLFQYVGDPVTFMLGQEATPEERVRLRSDLGLDKPFVVQFGRFVGNAAQGEFGLSLRQGRKVSSLIKERLPATLDLSLAAVVIAYQTSSFVTMRTTTAHMCVMKVGAHQDVEVNEKMRT